MKKVIAILITTVLVTGLIATPVLAAPKPKPPSGPHYNLNIIGKKADFNPKDGFNNPDRHTIFVPEDTTGFKYLNPAYDEGIDPPEEEYIEGSVKIEISQNKSLDDIAITDGTAFDGDGTCAIEVPDKVYTIWICAKAKPNPNDGPIIDGMVFYDDLTNEWLFSIGQITVHRNWQDANDLLYVLASEDATGLGIVGANPLGATIYPEGMWIFDYLAALDATIDNSGDGSGIDTEQMEYFWNYDNNGSKLVKVRLYER